MEAELTEVVTVLAPLSIKLENSCYHGDKLIKYPKGIHFMSYNEILPPFQDVLSQFWGEGCEKFSRNKYCKLNVHKII